MASVIVTLGTDGTQDWVRTPDGQRFNLGPLSVLSFVSKLAKNSRVAKQALDRYLKGQEALITVDAEKMWGLMTPRRAIWAADSFMPPDQQHQGAARSEMSTIHEDLSKLERTVAYLNKLASEGKTNSEAWALLAKQAEGLQVGRNKSAAYYGLGDLKVASGTKVAASEKLSFDTYKTNLDLAGTILERASKTASTINKKASEGKKFNSVRALADVRSVALKTASICEHTELTEGWVERDLRRLASEMTHIHDLFHPTSS